MKNCIIKIAKKKDYEKIAEIYKENFSEKPFNEKWTLKESIDKIKLYSKYCDIWKAEKNNEIIGYLIINPNQWKPGKIIFGEGIGVRKKFRNKKVATNLLQFVWEHYKEKGYIQFMAIINKDAKSFGFIKKFNLKISKDDILIKKELK